MRRVCNWRCAARTRTLLGSAAGYGTPNLDISRESTRRRLSFDVTHEPVTAVQLSRGKAEAQLLFEITLLTQDMGRLAADLVLFYTHEFGFGNEQFENLVEHLFRVRVLAVNLVDDHNRLGPGLERLAEDEACLRLRAFGGIHHQQHAVNHVHDALHLAAEIRVAGRVHDVDVVILVFERGVFGADGDALFLFQIHRIHQALLGWTRAGWRETSRTA